MKVNQMKNMKNTDLFSPLAIVRPQPVDNHYKWDLKLWLLQRVKAPPPPCNTSESKAEEKNNRITDEECCHLTV